MKWKPESVVKTTSIWGKRRLAGRRLPGESVGFDLKFNRVGRWHRHSCRWRRGITCLEFQPPTTYDLPPRTCPELQPSITYDLPPTSPVSHLRSVGLPLYSGFTEDAGRMMSASNRSATRSIMILNEPLSCVRSKARRNW